MRNVASRNVASRNVASLLVAAGLLLGGLAVTTLAGDVFFVYVLMWICIHALLALSVRLVLLIGEMNLATAAFYGVGAYTAGIAAVKWGLPTLVGLALGVVVAFLVGLAFGAVTLKTTGAYFLLVGFAFVEILRILYSRTAFLGGNSGLVGIIPDIDWFPQLMVASVVVVAWLLWRFEASRYGIVMQAIANHPDLTEVLGYRTHRVKTGILAMGSAVAGLAGGLYANFGTIIAPTDYGFMISIYAVAWVILGGRSSIWGPILGAATLTWLAQQFRSFGDYEDLLYGLTLILAMLFMPNGMFSVGRTFLQRVRQRLGPSGSVDVAGAQSVPKEGPGEEHSDAGR